MRAHAAGDESHTPRLRVICEGAACNHADLTMCGHMPGRDSLGTQQPQRRRRQNMSATEQIKSGKGLYDRTTSELATFFHVRPGHEEELREALARFEERVRTSPPAETVHTGLRSTRHVIFDEGTRLLWCTTFETDFDPYFDDALLTVGVANFIQWIQHTVEGEAIIDWYERNGGAAAFDKSSD